MALTSDSENEKHAPVLVRACVTIAYFLLTGSERKFLMNHKLISLALLLLAFGAIAYASRSRRAMTEDLPQGWLHSGSQPQNYEMSLDKAVKHTGKAGAHIRFIAAAADGFGTLSQVFTGDAYRGKRLRMSAWMRTENADSAQFWLRLDSSKRTVGFDNMGQRAVTGTTDWKKYELTLDVPAETIRIAFGILLVGKGQVWVDDFAFEEVGKDVPSTNMVLPEQINEEHEQGQAGAFPAQPANLNFEAGILTPAEESARMAREKVEAEAARKWLAANAIRLNTVEAGHGFDDMQPLKKLIGKARIVSLGEATHGTREFFQLKHRMLEFLATEMGFTIFSIEANMPEAYRLNDYVLNGKGDPAQLIHGMYFWTWDTQEVLDMVLWMREFNKSGKGRVQFTGFDMQTPTVAADIVRDFVAVNEPDYSSTLSPPMAGIKKASGPGFGIATAKFPVKEAAGKRIRLSGYIKTEGVTNGYAGLWWRVDGASGVLSLDNMQDRGATGTTDWKRYEIELPVTADAKSIYFGALFPGNGKAWFDGLAIEVDGVPYTNREAFDPDFESTTPLGFQTGGNGYLVELDSQVFHDGKQSLRMMSKTQAGDAKDDNQKLTNAWKEIVRHLETSRAAYAKKGAATRDIEWTIQNARVVLQSLQLKTDDLSRDHSMADNVKWILDNNPDAKIVLWAHNGHVATGSPEGYEPMGATLRKIYGERMVVFGFAFNEGSFQAMEMPFPSKRGLRNFTVDPAPEGSLDAMLAAAGLNIAAIDLRKLPKQGPVTNWFGEPRATRSIGSGYGEQYAADFLEKQATPRYYDALLFVEKTTAARPLLRQQSK
jgi:erythromycin esterase-like protein